MSRQQKYRSKRGTPACVKIWDRAFRHSTYCLNWLITQGEVYSHIPEIQTQTGLSEKEATVLAWNAYCAAAVGATDSPLLSAYEDLLVAVPVSELPLFIYWTSLGVDVNKGLTQQQAQNSFIEWLEADEGNGLFDGGYRLLPSLTVVQE